MVFILLKKFKKNTLLCLTNAPNVGRVQNSGLGKYRDSIRKVEFYIKQNPSSNELALWTGFIQE